MTLKQRLEWLYERNFIMFFLWEERFLNPLIPSEMQKLTSSNILNNDGIFNLINQYFPKFEESLPTGMYFPVPICKSIKKGEKFSPELAIKFHYEFIQIDDNQKWHLQKKI